MTAPQVAPADTPADEAHTRHLYCKVCYGVPHTERATFPVTSMCGWVTRTPGSVRTSGPMCPVCQEYEDADRCPRRHRLKGWTP